MESPSAHAVPEPDDVLKHLEWVRALAVQIVRNPAEADDLRQEVWLLSQRLNRPGKIPLRGWLGGILRNVVRERRRASSTRSLHEQTSALERALAADTPAMLRELSVQQVVMERLAQLREPYRSTLLACYFENLSHAEIAEREGVTLHAVRSRIQRGLGELRGDLAELKMRGTSALSLLAYTTWEPSTYSLGAASQAGAKSQGAARRASRSGSALPVPAPVLVTGLAAVLAGGFLAALAWQDRGTPPRNDDQLVQAPTPFDRLQAAGTAESATARRREEVAVDPRDVESQAPVAPLQDSEAAAPGTRSVKVIDMQGRPVPGVSVAFLRVFNDVRSELGPESTTDTNGDAMVAGVVGSGTLVCDSPKYHQVGFPRMGDDVRSDESPVAVVGLRTAARGRVLSASGEPIEGAQVRLIYRELLPDPVGAIIERSNQPEQIDTTASDGTFSVSLAQSKAPLRLTVSKPGLTTHLRPGLLFDGAPDALEIVLEAPTSPRYCHGRVINPAGEPVKGAWVADGTRAVRTNGDGVFDLGILPEGAVLWAGAPGFQPASGESPDNLQDLEIELSGAALQIEGRATYPDGSAAAGLKIRLPTASYAGDFYFYHSGRSAYAPVTLESFGRPMVGYRPSSVAATTDAEGRFVIEGLREKDYELDFIDITTALRVRGLQFPAGARGIQVEIPARHAPLSGVVRTPEGTALSGVLLRTFFDGPRGGTGPQSRSNGEGQFQFEGLVPGTLLYANTQLPWVHTGTRVTEARKIEIEVEPAARLTLTVDRQRRLAENERQPTSLTFLDQGGVVVPVIVDDLLGYLVERVSIPTAAGSVALVRPLIVPIRAVELVLSDDEGDITTVPLGLAPGADVQIRE